MRNVSFLFNAALPEARISLRRLGFWLWIGIALAWVYDGRVMFGRFGSAGGAAGAEGAYFMALM